MRLDTANRRAARREAQLIRRIEAGSKAGSDSPQWSGGYYQDAEDCGHLAHVRQIVNGRCARCQKLTIRDGNGNLVA